MIRFSVDMQDIVFARSPLYHTRAAIERGRITVGFLGGSITEPIDTPWEQKRWPDKLTSQLLADHPGLIVNVENAAKGATGSESAVFRADTDILERHCDLVFLEYAVNDYGFASAPRYRCREGLIRKLLRAGGDDFDLVVVYTYNGEMLPYFQRSELPPSIAEFEELCEYYKMCSVHMGLYAYRYLQAGLVRYEEWLPDSLHAGDVGSRLYAEPVSALIADACENARPQTIPLPAPLFADNWENACKLDMDSITRCGPWKCVRNFRLPTADRILETNTVGAALEFTFEGSGLDIFFRFHGYSAGCRLSVDGGEWREIAGACPDTMREAFDWIHNVLADGFGAGRHRARLETVAGAVPHGTHFELCDIGIVP